MTLSLGYACNWDPDAQHTWSRTPWCLREALRRHADVADVGITLPPIVRAGFKALHTRRRGGQWVSSWKHSKLLDATCQRLLSRGVTASGCDAVLEIQDLASQNVPFFLYQDLTYESLLRTHDAAGSGIPHFPALNRDAIRRRRDRQHALYSQAAGLFVMSQWSANALVEWSGVPVVKVHVVYPGRSAMELAGNSVVTRPPDGGAHRRRLLLVGRDFHTKGGDVVVAAHKLLRASVDPDMTLTIAGPTTWPLPGPVPDGVTFLGQVPVGDIPALYARHDLLVMPSRLEGFGIVFVEALAHGLPCVARRAFAMPEIVVPGENGGLVDDDDPVELARVIVEVLRDDRVYETCRRRIPEVIERFSWNNAARTMVSVIERTIAG